MLDKNESQQLVMVNGQKAFTTSKCIAERFGKTHNHVLESIRKLSCSDEFRESNFRLSSYVSLQNKTLSCYEITRDGFAILAMSFTGKAAMKWKEKYINAFNSMEQALISVTPVMDELNSITKRVQLDKDNASEAGRILSNYKKVAPENKRICDEAYKKAQLALGFQDS